MAAETPDRNWNLLRHVLAVARGGTLAGAARLLGVDETTVARHLARAEAGFGARLFDRVDGTLRPTAAGAAAVAHAERIEAEVLSLTAAVGGLDAAVAGTVRVTAVPMVANRILVPAIPDLLARHPGLRVELVAEPRTLSLGRREADLAVRLARPAAGAGLVTRRIGRLAYGIYAPAGSADPAALPWITYDDAMADLPQARWIAAEVARASGAPSPLAVNDAEAILQAIRAGVGRSLLPVAVADGLPGLRRIDGPGPLPVRELWLLVHRELRRLARIRAAIGWIERVLDRLP